MTAGWTCLWWTDGWVFVKDEQIKRKQEQREERKQREQTSVSDVRVTKQDPEERNTSDWHLLRFCSWRERLTKRKARSQHKETETDEWTETVLDKRNPWETVESWRRVHCKQTRDHMTLWLTDASANERQACVGGVRSEWQLMGVWFFKISYCQSSELECTHTHTSSAILMGTLHIVINTGKILCIIHLFTLFDFIIVKRRFCEIFF